MAKDEPSHLVIRHSSFVLRRQPLVNLRPDALTTFAHLSISVLMWAANCSGVLPTPSAPLTRQALLHLGRLQHLLDLCGDLSTISFGVPAGASKPNQNWLQTPASQPRRWSARSAKRGAFAAGHRRWPSACRP